MRAAGTKEMTAHCQRGTSDKLYVSMVRDNSDGTYSVVGKWKARTVASFQQKVKFTTPSLQEAIIQQQRLFDEKLKEGYVDISSPSYRGPMLHTPGSEPEAFQASAKPAKPAKAAKAAPAVPVEKDCIVKCVDNSGVEDRFDKDIEYVCEGWHEDPEMAFVYDKFGRKHACFKSRFVRVEEAA